MGQMRFMPVVWIFALFAGCMLCEAADPAYDANFGLKSNSLIQPGVAFEGEGEVWTPTPQNKEKSKIVKWHWKLTIESVHGEKFTGVFEWIKNEKFLDKVEGTISKNVNIEFEFGKKIKGKGHPDFGGIATASVNNAGLMTLNYARPNKDRVGEFSGMRSPGSEISGAGAEIKRDRNSEQAIISSLKEAAASIIL